MSRCDDYQLLDFGDGRRLERFARFVLDRPCPAAERVKRADPVAWRSADARFNGRDAEKGDWTDCRELPERWTVAFDRLRFELKRTDFGHLGIFPEQAENWRWISSLAAAGTAACGVVKGDVPSAAKRVLKVLNLFAYTGGSTLAAAAAGMEVVHLDAAKNVVAWARRNAELSGLADASIRWIADDAVKFVKREIKRGCSYDAVILDPPSYGHGSRGEVWRLAKDLPPLFDLCGELTDGRPAFVLLTSHTPGYDAETLRSMMVDVFGNDAQITAKPLGITDDNGRRLSAGVVVRWQHNQS
ncbi:MAG: SAM-dependent methyltransferase [Pirellulaceae bacterium]|nr:SAM-dependent methyltransferase [Pirellulaceae bacterium]